MNTKRKALRGSLMVLWVLLLTGALMGMATAPSPQPEQAAARKTRTPTRTPTAISSPTPSPAPNFTPTAGPTTPVDGTWKIVTSPNVGTGTYGNQLNAAAVVSANDVWAVGFSPDPSGTPLYIRRTLIEHWDGRAWSVIPSPNPAGKTYVVLNGIAAISAGDIWAVGHAGDPSSIPLQTLTLHWNGSTWSIIPSPSPGTYNGNVLSAAAAISSSDVWAVGWYQSGSTGQEGGALTLHWDGTAWSVVPNPSHAALHAVTAIARNDVWAAGDGVILHWNGTAWSIVTFPPPPGDSYQVFEGMDASSASDIWAVGYAQSSYFSGYRYSPLTYHWDGTSWSNVFNAGTTDETLHAVAAIAPNDAWVVGDNGQTQHWDGAAWSRVSAPYPGLGGRLNGLAAASSRDVWAVGYYVGSDQNRTWIERYSVP